MDSAFQKKNAVIYCPIAMTNRMSMTAKGSATPTVPFNAMTELAFHGILFVMVIEIARGNTMKTNNTDAGVEIRSPYSIEDVSNLMQKAEVETLFHRHRRRYEQLSEFNKERIIGMREAGWSAWRGALQVGQSDLTLRRCLETSFTQ
ncbi:hypothetical protein TNCV_4965551 [Trichonephila clavipes]|nr:hypothetical protein TNCV_4965551 [Trichonephila clavipes]